MSEPTKTCSKCGGEIPPFVPRAPTKWPHLCRRHRLKAAKEEWAARNPDKINEYRRANRGRHIEKKRQQQRESAARHPETTKKWREANAEKVKIYTLRHRAKQYGLTVEQFNQMLAEQGGACKICSEVPEGRALHIDHNHETGEVRGLLCSTCNSALGLFDDSPELLEAAAAYVRRDRIKKGTG